MFTITDNRPAAVARVRERALLDLWSYFDEMALDLEDQGEPEDAVKWATGWRETMEAALRAGVADVAA